MLEDGTEVYFNSETKFRYPVKFEESERRVFLEGEAYFKVKRDERPFSVEMGGNRIEVLGTEFNARFYPDEDKQMTTLVSGKVKFISGKDAVSCAVMQIWPKKSPVRCKPISKM